MSRRSMFKRVGALGVVLLTAIGAPAFSPGAAAAPLTDDASLPDGTYRTGEVTRAELSATGVAAGFSAEEAEAFLDEVGLVDHVELSHRLERGIWHGTVTIDGGIEDVTSRGPFEVVDENTVIAPGFCGPVTLGYAIDGDSVTFEVIDDPCDAVGDDEARFFNALNFESAPFVRAVEEAGDEPVTLFSNGFGFGTDRYFAEVERLTGGTISISGIDGDAETLIDYVRDGVLDIAVIGPPVFAAVGMDRVAALAPPLLIDSYDLEREVFARGLPDRLLDGLDELGVVPVAVVPGPLQKLGGFDRTFRTLDDFDGAVVAASYVGMDDDIGSALGATSEHWDDTSPTTGPTGIVITVEGMRGRHFDQEAEAATGNLNVFAVPWVVIVNADTWASLDAEQQAAFRDAGPATVDDVIASIMAGQDEALGELCAFGLEFVTMGDDDLAAIRSALDPVYADLAADPDVAAYIEAVEQLKAELGVGPDSATCPTTTEGTAATASTPGDDERLPEGIYRTSVVTREELIATGVAAGFSAEQAEAFLAIDPLRDYVEISHRLANGVWTITVSRDTGLEDAPWRGLYEVVDENTVIAPGYCGPVTLGYAIDGDTVTFDVIDDECDDEGHFFNVLGYESAPFVRVDEGDADSAAGAPDTTAPSSSGSTTQAETDTTIEPASADATAESGWTHGLGDAARSGVADTGPTGEPVELWRFRAEGHCQSAPIVVGQTAFVACSDSNLYALSVTDGSESWRFHADAPFASEFGRVGLAATAGLVYAVDEVGTLYAVDMATGTEVWRLDAQITTSPATEGGLLVVGTIEGALVGIDAATGVERWRYLVPEASELATSPAIANGLVYAANVTAELTAVNASTGELVWQSDTGGPTLGVRVIDGIAYTGARGGDGIETPLSAFDADTGDLLWRREGGLILAPAVVGGVAYSGSLNGAVYAFDTTDGSELWRVEAKPGSKASQPPVVAGGIVYVITNGVEAVFAYDAATGEELWRFDVTASTTSPAAAGGRLYATDFFEVFAIGGSDQFPDAGSTSGSTTADTTAPVSTPGDESLPEGLYRTRELADDVDGVGAVTRDELVATVVAAGLIDAAEAEELDAILADDGVDTVAFGLRLADGVWTQLESQNGGPEGIGWRGTYEVVDDHTVIATEGCYVITYNYAFDGEQLTLDVVDDQCDGVDDEGDMIWQTFIYETAPFVRVDEDG